MRKNSLLLLTMVLTVFLAGSLWAADVSIQVEPTTLFQNTTGNIVTISMANPSATVMGSQANILFDTSCFTVTKINKTPRTSSMDLVKFNPKEGGIIVVFTAFDPANAIAPGTGAVATLEVSVSAGCAEDCYVWDVSGAVAGDPGGAQLSIEEIDNEICVSIPACIPELNATTFNLGNVRLNGSGTAALTVKNIGTAAGEDVTITGVSAVPATFDLAVNATQAVTITYTPTALGPFTVTGTIAGCGDDVTFTLTGTGVCSQVATNCPLAFGDVTVVETKTLPLTINNPGTAALNISGFTFSDPDFTSDAVFPMVIAAGGNATVNVTVAPSAVEGLVTETLIIASDACAGPYTCTLTVNKMTPPYVILYIDPVCQVIKPDVPFGIQVKIRQVTDIQPVQSIYFCLCLDTCIAFFDPASITMETGKSVIDSMGWDIKVHYLEAFQDDPTCLEVWLIGGTELTEDGCLVNIDLVPNTGCYIDEYGACTGGEVEITFCDVLINEGAPDNIFEDAVLELNEAPDWCLSLYTVERTEGYPNMFGYTFAPDCFGGDDFIFCADDVDGDEMFVEAIIRDSDWATLRCLPQPFDTIQTGVIDYVNPFPCEGESHLDWVWSWVPDKDCFTAAFPGAYAVPYPVFQDTLIVSSSQSWPSAIVCYDTTLVDYILNKLAGYAVWDTIESYACDGPEPHVQLCVDTHYFTDITAMGAADPAGGIYSIDMILDYDCDCLVPYEVGFEGLLTEEWGALTYTINEELCKICVSIALNRPLLSDDECVDIMYVGFMPQGEAVDPKCVTGYRAELSIEHVKVNEAYLNMCWSNGWIEYIDFAAAGHIQMSDYNDGNYPNEPLAGVSVIVTDKTCDGAVVATLTTNAAGNFSVAELPGCGEFCFTPEKSMLGEEYIDDFVTAQDASWILRSLCHQIILTDDQIISADVTCDGNVTAYDAATLLRWLVGLDVEMCIGGFVFEPECLCRTAPYTPAMVFEAALIGDVTGNYAGTPKSVVTTPEMTFKGNNATITLNGEVYSAVLELVGVKASNVTVNGMEYQWRTDGNVTKIAIASGTPVDGAVVSVAIESGNQVELFGNVNEVSFATRVEKIPVVPADFSLAQNYPNPFNPTTSIEYGLPVASQVKVSVYNVLGQVVMELVNEVKEAGMYSVQWDASQMASGVYFYRIEAGSFTATRQMVLMK